MTETILRGVVGSHAYGLNHEESDIDRMGVFVAPTLSVAGLDWHSSKESRINQGPDGDDIAEHEIGKFLRLVLKANPTVTELLWLPNELYEVRTVEGRALRILRCSVLSGKAVVDAYQGYARAQVKKYREGCRKAKYARHALRLIDQGRGLYRDGYLQVKVDNPQKYFDLSDMTTEQVMDTINSALKKWDDLGDKTPLPEKPDIETVKNVLNGIRRSHL